MMKLPLNKELLENLRVLNIESNNNENWSALLDGQSLHKLLYSLKIVKDLMKDEEWKSKFLNLGGIHHLFT
jgi:hypothetical protein